MVAAAIIGGAVVGGVASSSASSKAASAQNRATDAASAAAGQQNALTQEQFEWNKQIYERDTAPMQRQQMELQTRVANDALARAAKQDRLADEQKEYYDTTFKPIEKKVASDAMGYDSDENVGRRSGIAAANVNQQFSNARGQSARLAGRYGLGSTAFSVPAGAAERAQALGTAGAATGAALETMDKGIQLRAGAANFGRNMPNTALTAYSGANSSGTNAGNAANAALNGTISATAGLNSAYGARVNGINSATGLFTNAMNNSANMWNNNAAGWGNFAGGMFQKAISTPGIMNFGGMQAAFSQTDLGSSGYGTGLAYGNQDYGAYI